MPARATRSASASLAIPEWTSVCPPEWSSSSHSDCEQTTVPGPSLPLTGRSYTTHVGRCAILTGHLLAIDVTHQYTPRRQREGPSPYEVVHRTDKWNLIY